MNGPFTPRVGGVPSADIAVPEHERELRFYAQVLTTGTNPLWRDDLMNDHGMPVIGLGARSPEYASLPLQWMPHIQVADVATSVERALALGGRALMHGKDDDGRSQWAVLLDPNGAAFGIIPVVDRAPPSEVAASDPVPRTGCIAWLDLVVADVVVTRDFYREVIGWSVQDEAGERIGDTTLLAGDGRPVAAIRSTRGVSAGLPPVWTIHLPVDDLDESLRRVRSEGGVVLHETDGSDGSRARAVVQDPVGVVLALMQG